MQKVFRRVELAKAQAKRKSRILKEAKEKREDRSAHLLLRKEKKIAAVSERKQRREDWNLGALAPNRREFVGERRYGTFSTSIVQPSPIAIRNRAKDIFIREGDRVCVMAGGERIKGQIGIVRSIDKSSQTAKVDGIGPVEVRLPKWIDLEGSGITSDLQALQLKDLNLVHPLPDPVTGIPRDCILTNLVKADEYFDIYKNKKVWSRMLMPQRITIPWPKEEQEKFVDEEVDTLRIDVEDISFLPTLLRPPMPNNVIDELRNRNSRYRTRHEEEYVAKKLAEDAVEERQKRLSEALRPHGARNIARSRRPFEETLSATDEVGQAEKPAPGTFMADRNQKPVISEALLEKIGAHMAQNGFDGKKVRSATIRSATLAVEPVINQASELQPTTL